MIIKQKKFCINCMHEMKEGNICPKCNFDQNNYQFNPRHILPGTILKERYVIGRVLGEGSFGITYIAYDLLLTGILAIKEFYPLDYISRDAVRGSNTVIEIFDKEREEEYREKVGKFLNEARILSKFDRESSIVSVSDFFYENNTAYIVMEYIPGPDLKTYINEKGPMSGEEALTLMKPLIEALGRLHENKMLHRDISPDNILFNKDKLVLIDFGGAKCESMETFKSATILFKRGFSPEEQYMAHGNIGPWTDIYAICASIYFMITGEIPQEASQRFICDDLESLLNMKKIELAEIKKRAIMKGLAVKAKDRFQNINELKKELFDDEADGKRKKQKIIIMASIIIVIFGIMVLGNILKFLI